MESYTGATDAEKKTQTATSATAEQATTDLVLTYREHDTIFHEGDDIESYFEVLDGSVMLYKFLPDGRRQVVEILSPGTTFGLSCDDTRDCSAETLMASRLRVLQRSFCNKVPQSYCRLCRQMQEELRELRHHTVLLGRKSAMERVTSFILFLVFGRSIENDEPCDGTGYKMQVRLPMTRQEIADYLGLTIETVSRTFSDLKRRGLIDFQKNDWIKVVDLKALDELSGKR